MAFNFFGFNINIFEIPITIILFIIIFLDICFCGTKISIRKNNSIIFYFGLMVLFLVSILLSSISAIKLSAIIKSFFKWIEIFCISSLVFLYIRNSKRFKFIYWLIFTSFMSSLVFVLAKTLNNHLYFFDERILPGYDSLFAIALLIPFTVSQNKKFLTLLTLLLLLSAILSLSRGVWISIIILTIYYFRVNKNKKIIKLIAIALPVIFIVALLFAPFSQFLELRIDEMFTTDSVSNVERIAMIKYSLIGFSNSPFWGIGALNFPDFLLSEGFTKGIVAKDVSVLEPHNLFLQTLTEEGFFGFLIIFLFFFNIFIILFKNSSESFSYDKAINPYILGLKILFIAIIINLSLGFIANQFRFNLALFLGLTISLFRISPAELCSQKKNII